MRQFFILLCCLFYALPTWGIELDFRGHLRGQGALSNYDSSQNIFRAEKDNPFVDGASNLRLVGQLNLQVPVTLRIDYEAGILGGDTRKVLNKTNGGFQSYTDSRDPSDASRLFDLTHISGEGGDHLAYHRLDRLLLSWQGERVTVQAGRQALSWGNGLIFNPADLLNPFSPTDIIRDYKVGTDMLVFQTYTSGIDDWQLIYVPRRDPLTGDIEESKSSLASKVRWTALRTEWDLLLAHHYDETVLGAGASGYLGGAAWRSDFVYTFLGNDAGRSGYHSAVANIDYTWILWERNWYGMVELFYNGIGEGDPRDIVGNVPLRNRLIRGELFATGMAYAAGQLHCEYHPLLNLYLTIIQNLSDGSMIIQPRLVWDARQDLQVLAGMDIPVGSMNTEFGGVMDPDSGASSAPAKRLYIVITGYF